MSPDLPSETVCVTRNFGSQWRRRGPSHRWNCAGAQGFHQCGICACVLRQWPIPNAGSKCVHAKSNTSCIGPSPAVVVSTTSCSGITTQNCPNAPSPDMRRGGTARIGSRSPVSSQCQSLRDGYPPGAPSRPPTHALGTSCCPCHSPFCR